ncbi:MAG: mannosyl-3-phosphoglycerate phosphatase [Dehalococcoidia bacterium]|nr:MAG: mannosyl-3-phosphoglycerate phosphatase [Dehalococcoidia bacterium]
MSLNNKHSSAAKTVIFTDLDGSLLDPFTYSEAVTSTLVASIVDKGIPLIFCSSKTRAEQEVYRRRMGIADPFIVENGGAIFIKRGYFPFAYQYQRVFGDYHVIELGIAYPEIRERLKEISRQHKLTITGFGDMTPAEIAKLTGLDLASAKLAQEREYEESLHLEDRDIDSILPKIAAAGLTWNRGGKLYGVSGGNDKGRATQMLTRLFRQKLGRIKTIGIGDSSNDLPMLAEVDFPVLVQKPGHGWEEIDLPRLYRVKGEGPRGWTRAIRELTSISGS